jgi:crotonobetainyl-CoA:carnitine CoA-transferase CaiB-like acyl-CoA transferase
MGRGASDLTGGVICYNVYQALDGYMTISALEPRFWAAFCDGIGRQALIGQQFARAVPGEPAYDELCALFLTRTRQEWVEALASVDACCEPVHTIEEALASGPVGALKMLTGSGLLPPVRLSARGVKPVAPAPGLGEHTVELLSELSYSGEEITKLRDRSVV